MAPKDPRTKPGREEWRRPDEDLIREAFEIAGRHAFRAYVKHIKRVNQIRSAHGLSILKIPDKLQPIWNRG